MAKIDEVKEHIGALKSYMNIIVAIILTIGAGISKLYLAKNINILFWIGVGLILLLLGIFVIIAKALHKNIKKLEEL